MRAKTKLTLLFSLLTIFTLLFITSCDNDTVNSPEIEDEGILYVANQTEGTVYRFDVATMTRIDSISSVIPQPHWIEFSPDGNYYFLNTRFPPAFIAKFDVATNTFVDTAHVRGTVEPTAMVITNDNIGYVCDFTISSTPGHFHKYNTNTMKFVDSSLSNGAASHDLKITSDRKLIVATSRNTDDVTLVYVPEDSVFFIPLDSNNIRPPSPVYGPYGVAIDHRDSLAYIACLSNGQVRIVDLYERRVIDSIVIPFTPHPSFMPSGPTLMAISPDNSKIFVTTQWGNSIVVADLNTRSVLADIPVGIGRPFGVKMNAGGTKAFVACVNETDQPGEIYVIDGNSLAKIDSVSVGKNSFSLEWRP